MSIYHFQFVDMELRLASPSDEDIYVLTDLTSIQLKNVIEFVRHGILPVTTGKLNFQRFIMITSGTLG